MLEKICKAGLYLVPIPPIGGKPTKAPHAKSWNQPQSANNPNGFSNNAADFVDCERFNFGIAHLPSKTAAFDLDSLSECITLFDDVGLPIQDWLNDLNRVEIKSGKPNRGKLLFRLPHGVESFNTRQYEHNKTMLFELRNASKTGATVQDVIIGTHPDTGTTYQVIGDIANIPEIPDGLLNVALHWDSWRLCFDSALGIVEPPQDLPRETLHGENLKGWRNPVLEFNQSFSVQDILLRNGYRAVGKDRFIRPGSTSKAPGIKILTNCKNGFDACYSHGGDALNDGYKHDAFDCFRLLEHGGDW
ncbi:bifunctional DNA primase/polymerase [Methylobacter sp.]|uniref:bifunctional DNA primase/polymerase n=1 Tax=Methylobacter sp. TaxID=2051955 RepID=UPI002488F875|nr:bifunctional DNA primase/polymerase [Methylobacter sp.]MDI1278514.1 bifunctional DNA primase/polymerase [Methylobacter sp.]MDI1359290.1 bifunctional DNA primase/polymerase [Methylobacter sp.]